MPRGRERGTIENLLAMPARPSEVLIGKIVPYIAVGYVQVALIRLAAHFRTPVLVSFGEKDYRVPVNNGLEYWSALQRQKVESRFIVFPDENHWVLNGENSRFFYQEVGNWLSRWLDAPKEKSATAAP
jgi:pimeloyl-ACP methyl ester carboxylesterase